MILSFKAAFSLWRMVLWTWSRNDNLQSSWIPYGWHFILDTACFHHSSMNCNSQFTHWIIWSTIKRTVSRMKILPCGVRNVSNIQIWPYLAKIYDVVLALFRSILRWSGTYRHHCWNDTCKIYENTNEIITF